jgi:salicylate hydroxylase
MEDQKSYKSGYWVTRNGVEHPRLKANMEDSDGLEDGFTFKNHPTLPIAIVGGGLCGLALAIGLVKHGVNVRIYESAAAFSEIGAGVAFGINSITALKLLDPRLLEGYKKHATYNADRAQDDVFYTMRWGMDERKKNGHVAGDLAWDMRDVWNYERAQKAGVRTRSCIHRARLLEELVALLPEAITIFGKSFEWVEEQIDGTIQIHFADGTTAHVSSVIGCDGIKSKVRRWVCPPDIQPTYARERAFRAVIPRIDAEAALGTNLALNGHLYCGYGAYIITYPIENGELINMVAIPLDQGEGTWEREDWTVPVTTNEILERFEGWYPPLLDLLSRYHLPSQWALFALQHDSQYYNGRVCLVGDSAHATVPHLGAGAGMAMEDAFVLSSLIAEVGNVDHIDDAFRAYDAVRRPRTQGCIRRSLQAAHACDLVLPGVEDDVLKIKETLGASFKWIWHEDLEAQLEKGKTFLKKN